MFPGCKAPEISNCREHQEEQEELDYHKLQSSAAKTTAQRYKTYVVEAIHSDWQIRNMESWEDIPAEKISKLHRSKASGEVTVELGSGSTGPMQGKGTVESLKMDSCPFESEVLRLGFQTP